MALENSASLRAPLQRIRERIASHTGYPHRGLVEQPLNLGLVPPDAWERKWSLEDPELSPGDYAIVGPDVLGYNGGFELVHVDDQIGNALLVHGSRTKPNTPIFHWVPRPGISTRVNFEKAPSVAYTAANAETPGSITYTDTNERLTASRLPIQRLGEVQIEIHEKPYDPDWEDPSVRSTYKVDRKTGIRKGRRNDIRFANDDLFLEDDVLIEGKIPIIVSDFHSKITTHLPLLGALGLVPDVKPTMDWLDAHHDRYTHHPMPKKLRETEYPKTLKEALAITRRSNIGWAAMHLNADVHDIVDGASRNDPMPNAQHSWLFRSREPLGRKNPNRPHILSFDLDQAVPFITSKAYGPHKRAMNIKNEELFALLRRKGLRPDRFDAALVYTSPFYSYDPDAAKLALHTFLDAFS